MISMTDSALARKMKRPPAGRAAIINAPADYQTKAFQGLPPAGASLTGKFDWIQIFVQNSAELAGLAPRAAKALKPDAMLWISFPKGSSKIQTDLTRDKGWEGLTKLDLKWLTLISVDETWSAFALRPYRPGEARQSFR
jgi:hypothetical protein